MLALFSSDFAVLARLRFASSRSRAFALSSIAYGMFFAQALNIPSTISGTAQCLLYIIAYFTEIGNLLTVLFYLPKFLSDAAISFFMSKIENTAVSFL